jgi:hypothetical protein
MKTKLAIILIILILGFLASRIRFEEPAPQQHSQQPITSNVAETTSTRSVVAPQNTLFNLNGEWRGTLQPLHGSHLDPRDWKLEVKFFIYAGQVRVYIRRGEQWQEVKPGKFRITQHKTNAIIYSMDSGGGWVESWVFSVSRHDRDSINVYGNRIINNFKQAADAQSSRITYGATGNFVRVYERHKTNTVKKSPPLNDKDIASQIQQAIERGKRLAGGKPHGQLEILEHRVTHETDDSAVLLVKYHYDGLNDDNAWISAITFNDGQSTGHRSFRPVKLRRGKRAAHIRIGMSSASPDKYCSDNFVIQAYVSGGGNFFEKAVPYERCWSKK